MWRFQRSCIRATCAMSHNYTVLVTETDDVNVETGRDGEYDSFVADVWVGVVLTLMVLSCVCCVCSCLLYHKFQQWKTTVLEGRCASLADHGAAPGNDLESLPSYTIVSGLPTYEEALEQLRQTREHRIQQPMVKLSVIEFFQMYKPPM